MPKQTRYKESGGPARRPSGGPGVPVVPLLALFLLIGFAVFLARRVAREGAEAGTATEQAPAYVPFASVPDEEPPARRLPGQGPAQDLAPEGLERHPTWQRALEKAEQARQALDLSQAARRNEDFSATQLHGRQALDAYQEAIQISAEWMEDLVGRYTEDDRQVRHFARVRDGWFQRLTALRRTTGR